MVAKDGEEEGLGKAAVQEVGEVGNDIHNEAGAEVVIGDVCRVVPAGC